MGQETFQEDLKMNIKKITIKTVEFIEKYFADIIETNKQVLDDPSIMSQLNFQKEQISQNSGKFFDAQIMDGYMAKVIFHQFENVYLMMLIPVDCIVEL